MLFPAPAPPPVSYSSQIAPILALHCNGCHGEAGGLSTRDYAALMKGGNLGKVVLPGDAEGSLLLHFIEGRRGEEHRMPLGGAPLPADQVAAIRRWIAEGAQADADTSRKYRVTLPRVRVNRHKVLRVYCKVNTQSYLILTVSDPRSQRPLLVEVASIKAPRERGDAGSPGEKIWWEVRPARRWPKRIAVELTIAYAEREPEGTELFVESRQPEVGRDPGPRRAPWLGKGARSASRGPQGHGALPSSLESR
jgi:cytochrome c